MPANSRWDLIRRLRVNTYISSRGILQILLNSRVHRVLTRARYWSIPWDKPDESSPHTSILLFKIRFNIPIYIQQGATLHSLLYLKTALYVSGGTSTHHQERIQLYLQHLVFVTPLLLPAAIVKELELCRAVCRYNKLCNVASCWIYIGIFLWCTDPWFLNLF